MNPTESKATVIPETLKQHSGKFATEGIHAKSVRAWSLALIEDGKIMESGRVVGHWSDNPNGSVCTVTIWVWRGELDGLSQTGKAGGYGYCKFSAAFAQAVRASGIETDEDLNGRGEESCRAWLERQGYTVLKALG